MRWEQDVCDEGQIARVKPELRDRNAAQLEGVRKQKRPVYGVMTGFLRFKDLLKLWG